MELPVLDAAGLYRGDGIDALRSACTDTGFFYIANHGIPAAMIDAALEQSRLLFALPIEQLMSVELRLSKAHRGYEPMQSQTLELGTPPDLKEGFYIGNERAEDDPKVLAGEFNQGPNVWPAALPAFRPAMDIYFAALTDVANKLMGAMARSLGLPPSYFDGFCHDPMALLRLLHYPPQPANPVPGEKGCGAHSDWGCLTLLYQDPAGGLQVRSGDAWIDAPPIDGTFVVNIGDMFQRWTNGRYRSTLHRVINRSGRDRYSMPFFYEGNPKHPVSVLDICVPAGEAPRYAPTTVERHLIEMYSKTYIAA